MSKKKVTFWIEEGEVELLKLLFNTDNQSETLTYGQFIYKYLLYANLIRIKKNIIEKPPFSL